MNESNRDAEERERERAREGEREGVKERSLRSYSNNMLTSNLERQQGLTESDYKNIRHQRDCAETARDQTGAPSLRPCRNWTYPGLPRKSG